MKKSFLFLLLTVFLLNNVYAKAGSEEKKIILQGGYGFSPLGLVGNTKGFPISFSLVYRISKDVSLGIYAGHHSTNFIELIDYGYTSIGGRLIYHVDFFENKSIDTYGVVSLGYCIVSSSLTGWPEIEVKESFILWGVGGGVRYFFTPNIGIFGEAGYGAGIDLLAIGISLKL